MTDLIWTPVKVRLGQIKPWEDNPRMSSKREAERLIQSERELGQMQTFAIGPAEEDGTFPLYDGHQRCKAWFTVKGASYEVTALQSNRPLRDEERRKVAILLHTATGEWDWGTLQSWESGELSSWGFDKDTLDKWNNDANNLKEFLNGEKETPIKTGEEAIPEQYAILITCHSEQEQTDMLERFIQEGLECRALLS